MKKLISGLMISIMASTCAMTAMAAPNDHKTPHAPHQMDKKPMPLKSGMKPAQHHFSKDKHFNKNSHHNQFDQKNHKAFANKNKMHNMEQNKPLPPKQIHRS